MSELSLKHAVTEDPLSAVSAPSILRDDELWQVYFKPDMRYGTPHAFAYFLIRLPDRTFGSGMSAREECLMDLYKASVLDALNDLLSPATDAGLQLTFDYTTSGVELRVSGYSARLAAFLDTVVSQIAAHVPSDAAKFERFKMVLLRDLDAWNTASPLQHASFYTDLYARRPGYEIWRQRAELERLTLAELQGWVAEVWHSGFGTALLHGNLSQADGLGFVARVEKAFPFTRLVVSERAESKYSRWPLTPTGLGSVIRREDPHCDNPDNSVRIEFQNSDRSLKQQAIMDLLGAILSIPECALDRLYTGQGEGGYRHVCRHVCRHCVLI